jgi:hypothetical protein
MQCNHRFIEEYYGHRCDKCGVFYAFGCAPWDDEDWFEQDVCEYCGKPLHEFGDLGCRYCDRLDDYDITYFAS